MPREKRGSVIYYSDGTIRTRKGTVVPKVLVYRGRQYILAGATGSRKDAERSAAGYRR